MTPSSNYQNLQKLTVSIIVNLRQTFRSFRKLILKLFFKNFISRLFQELKTLWEAKLQQSKTLEIPPRPQPSRAQPQARQQQQPQQSQVAGPSSRPQYPQPQVFAYNYVQLKTFQLHIPPAPFTAALL